jgi:hypothetical protein
MKRNRTKVNQSNRRLTNTFPSESSVDESEIGKAAGGMDCRGYRVSGLADRPGHPKRYIWQILLLANLPVVFWLRFSSGPSSCMLFLPMLLLPPLFFWLLLLSLPSGSCILLCCYHRQMLMMVGVFVLPIFTKEDYLLGWMRLVWC